MLFRTKLPRTIATISVLVVGLGISAAAFPASPNDEQACGSLKTALQAEIDSVRAMIAREREGSKSMARESGIKSARSGLAMRFNPECRPLQRRAPSRVGALERQAPNGPTAAKAAEREEMRALSNELAAQLEELRQLRESASRR